ncbi:MAG: peptidase M13 [Alphaproteobacteria bacterium]|nr:peptidase M13 [Alphaproteobacteria bacterium]
MTLLKSRRGAVLAAVSFMSASALVFTAIASGETRQSFGTWGVDLTSRDLKIKPGNDFFDYANGSYLARTEIPADQASTSAGYDVYNLTQEELRTLIEGSSAGSSDATAAQIGGLFKSFMDEGRVESLDAKPLAADLAAIQAVTTKAEFTALMGRTQTGFGTSLFEPQVDADAKKPISTLYIGQGGLLLPDRDYYLTDQFKAKKEAYLAFIARTLKLIDFPNADAAAKAVLDFETKIAEASWPAADRRDIDKIYNPMTVAQLQGYAPAVDWRSYLDAMGAKGVQNVVALENTAIQKIAQLYGDTPLDTLKAWQTFRLVQNASPFLSKRFVDSNFDFVGKTLSGTQSIKPRWKRGVALVDGSLGEAVGREYVRRYFPPSSKAKMDALVANLKTAMSGRIKNLSWMSPATKAQAQKKLAKMQVMVGYPVKWRDYSTLKIDPSDLYGNAQRATAFEFAYQLGKVGKPVDHQEWGMTPQTVNAYNGGLENKIVFPAGILQPPFFNPNADPAVNYGAIGAVIGHEITHGFDDQGRKIDAEGRLHDWWTAEDAKRFVAEADKLAAQYDSYEGAPGMHINGKLTLGENIADLGGLLVAIDAYHASLGGKPAPVIDGLTGDQRLLLAFAQVWRGKARDDALKAQMASDPHSPRKYRVIGPTRNIDTWYTAFDVQPTDKYYLKPEDRVHVW